MPPPPNDYLFDLHRIGYDEEESKKAWGLCVKNISYAVATRPLEISSPDMVTQPKAKTLLEQISFGTMAAIVV